MRHIETGVQSNQDISSILTLHTYTADRQRLIFMRLFISGVSGGGDYTAYLTIQRGGAGPEFYVVPLTVTPVDSGYGSICLTTIAIPINQGDIVRAYVKGRVTDTSVSASVEVWEDDSNFYTTAPGFYPSGSLGYALGRIGTSPTIRIQVPTMDTSRLELVRGDDYAKDHGTAIRLSSDQWPDLTGASVVFVTETFVVDTEVSGTREVLVELTNVDTSTMSNGYASLVATFPDQHVVTLVQKIKVAMLSRVQNQE